MKNFGSNVKRFRLARQLTLKDLSSKCSVSLSMLSEIERNTKMPTIEVACRIADALDVNILDLLDKQDHNHIRVIRKNERPVLVSADSYTRFLLSPSLPFSLIEFEYFVIPPGKGTGIIPPHKPAIKEYLVVASGEITLCIDQTKEKLILSQGDSVAYQIFSEHQIINSGEDEASFYYISENKPK